MSKNENFERAFSPGIGSCSATCACGREFYDFNGNGDFEEGELKSLEKDTKATALDHAVCYVKFEGVEYVSSCDCWHDRSNQIMEFIDGHAHSIAGYLKLERDRKIREAEAFPIV